MVAGQWYHIAAVFEPGSLELYIDGVSIGAGSTTAVTIGNSTRPLKIGDWYHTSDSDYQTFDGLLDEAAIHDRVLSQREIEDIYNAGHDDACRYQPE